MAIRVRRRPEAFAEELTGAIRSLGRAHDFVRPVDGEKGDSPRGLLRERGGPAAAGERHEGFGSRLIRTAVEGQLGGRLERRFTPGGFEVDLTMKVEAIRS